MGVIFHPNLVMLEIVSLIDKNDPNRISYFSESLLFTLSLIITSNPKLSDYGDKFKNAIKIDINSEEIGKLIKDFLKQLNFLDENFDVIDKSHQDDEL